MKRLFLLLLLLPSYVFACDCDSPSVALEFVHSEYVFWGTVVEKEYAKDSLTYSVTFKIDRHYKNSKEKPKTLKFTKESNDYLSSCGYSVNKGEKWMVYAYNYKDELVFSRPCSNSNRYKEFNDIRREELEILERGHDIDLQKIKFNYTIIGSLYNEYKNAEPELSINSLLAQLNPENYNTEDTPQYESVIIQVDSDGNMTEIAISNRKLVDIEQIYDIRLHNYGIQPEPLTALQKDILNNLKKAKKWKPASFTGLNVNSQITILVRFEKGKIPYVSNF